MQLLRRASWLNVDGILVVNAVMNYDIHHKFALKPPALAGLGHVSMERWALRVRNWNTE